MTTTRRARSASLLAGGVAIVVAGVALAATWPWGSHHVAMPEDSASAGDVVTTYLAALDAHDCATAVALSTASFAGTARDWCDDIASVRAVTTGDPTAEDPAWSGLPATAEVVSVPVTFEIDWRLLRGDGSFAEGRADWGYLLTRPSADEPWRIISNGFA